MYAAAVETARRERRRKTGTQLEGDAAVTAAATKANGGEMAKVKTLFVHLRKIANHPLLVRSRYTDTDVEEMAGVCHRRGEGNSIQFAPTHDEADEADEAEQKNRRDLSSREQINECDWTSHPAPRYIRP